MKSGYKPVFTDKRDYDLLKTFGAVGFDTTDLPDVYDADAGLTMPDQNGNGYPFGCTGYAQTDLCTDEDGVVYDAGELFLSTPPYTPFQGRDIRSSLDLIVKRGPKGTNGLLGPKREAYYNIRASGFLDWFDAIRVALYITRSEKRSASIGVPWFKEFESIGKDGLLPEVVNYTWNGTPGHNAKISGWKLIGGNMYLRVKSWQGTQYGDSGWCYMSRPLANAIFNMYYTEAFTVTKIPIGEIHTVDLTAVESVVSFIKNLLNKLWKQ